MRILSLVLLATTTATAANAGTPVRNGPSPQSISCVAAFELMHRAAPNWTRQPAVQQAWQSWEGIALDLTSQARVDFGEQVQREMETLANQTQSTPNALSQSAMKCIADAPNRSG
jgi:hypothetical protein